LTIALVCTAAISCGTSPVASQTPRELYELGPMAQFAWLLGDWKSEAGRWHWVAAGDKVYGVAFDPTAFRRGFAVMILEEERDAGRREGIPWLYAYDGPESFFGVGERLSESRVRFRQSTTDGPQREVTMSRGEGGLRIAARRSTEQRTIGEPEVSWSLPYAGERAPELEQADLALVAAVNDRKGGAISTSGSTWAAAFTPDGAYWCERCVGGAKGRLSEAELAPRNNPGRFDWVPIASRRSGNLGFTVGHISWRPRLETGVWRGTYLTIWERGLDGRWSVLFHTRRAALAALKEPES
jgi:ketosteroid isomerase-like protein